MEKVYVTTYEDKDRYYNDEIWTLSESPNEQGWETDSGCEGYGLSKEKAEFYAKCINYCIEHGIKFE